MARQHILHESPYSALDSPKFPPNSICPKPGLHSIIHPDNSQPIPRE